MNTDSAFVVGDRHTICQDYVSSNRQVGAGPDFRETGCIVLSDGCSASLNTDIGARLLTLELNNFFKISSFTLDRLDPQRLVKSCESFVKVLGVNSTCLDATLLSMHCYPGAHRQLEYQLFCAGDGVFVKIKTNGVVEVTEIEYTSGAPFYLSYLLDPDRKARYLEKFGLEKVVKKYTLSSTGPQHIEETRTKDESYFYERGMAQDYETFLVFSDGILQFVNNYQTIVESWRILDSFLPFKNHAGYFVQRRLQRFLKDNAIPKWKHLDDLSVGAIYLGA